MFTHLYVSLVPDVEAGSISHLDFLKKSKAFSRFKDWCKEHFVDTDEENAEFFYDMYGFAETEIVKEYIEPVA